MSSPQEIATRIFEQFDKDKSGSIDASEVKAMLQETYKGLNYNVTDQDVTETLTFLDANNDGKVSLQEYVDMVQKAWANKDK